MLGDHPVDIYPAEPVPLYWLVIALLVVGAILAMRYLLRRWIRRYLDAQAHAPERERQRLKQRHLAQLDAIIEGYRSGEITSDAAVIQASAVVRSYFGVSHDEKTRFMTLEELREASKKDETFGAVARFTAKSYDLGFAGGTRTSSGEAQETRVDRRDSPAPREASRIVDGYDTLDNAHEGEASRDAGDTRSIENGHAVAGAEVAEASREGLEDAADELNGADDELSVAGDDIEALLIEARELVTSWH